MNKLFPALATVLALGAGGAGLYLANKPGGFSLGTHLTAADYLPSETLVLLALPDPGKTLADWKTTDLYKIWSEPQVQTFLAKPLSKIPANPTADTVLGQITALDPKSLFIALTALDEKDSKPHIVGGFQFKGSKEDVERALAPAEKQLRDSSPAGKADLIEYQGHAIQTFDSGSNGTLASTYLGDWYLISNDIALLKATADRMDHRTLESQTPLSKDADFQTVGSKLASNYETLIFARPQPFLTKLYALLEASGQPVTPEKRIEADKVKALGATTSIENGKIRDTIYTLAPGLKEENGHLAMTSLPLSSPETLFYVASAIHWPEKFDFAAAGANSGDAASAVIQSMTANLTARGITPESLRAAFGSEGEMQLDWPAANLQPSILTSIEVRDRAAAQKIVDQLVATPLDDLPWQTEQANGRTYYTLNIPSLTMLQPTLTLTDKHLILGLDAPEVRDAVSREGTSAPTFTASEAYKAAFTLVDKPNVTFAFLDTKGMFERTYGLMRPYAIMGAAFLPPQYAEFVDLGKLPEIETISKHLSPSILSQTLDKEGAKLDSVGSVTFAESTAAFTGVATVVATTLFKTGLLDKYVPGMHTAPARIRPLPGATPSPVRPLPSALPTPTSDEATGNNP